MTNQIQGEQLFKGWAGDAIPGGEDTWAYTPWIDAAADFATFATALESKTSGVTFRWAVETRSRESASVTTILAARTVTTVGVDSAENTTAAKELIRYRFATGDVASTTEFAVFRALAPSWQRDR